MFKKHGMTLTRHKVTACVLYCSKQHVFHFPPFSELCHHHHILLHYCQPTVSQFISSELRRSAIEMSPMGAASGLVVIHM